MKKLRTVRDSGDFGLLDMALGLQACQQYLEQQQRVFARACVDRHHRQLEAGRRKRVGVVVDGRRRVRL